MSKLRKLIGIVLLAAVASFGVPSVLADTGAQESPGITSTGAQESPGVVGAQESPGITGAQESPGFTADVLTFLASISIH